MKKVFTRITLLTVIISMVFVIAISLTSEKVKADGAAGTWEGSATDQTGAADFHFHAKLQLTGGSSVSGSLRLTCTSVDVKISGFEDAQNAVGTTTTDRVDGTMSGSMLTLHVYDTSGTYTFTMTVSGGSMTGGTQYAGATTETNTWTFNLRGGGGGFSDLFGMSMPDLSFLMAPAAVIGLTGAVAGLAASSMPAPSGLRNIRSIKGRTHGPVTFPHQNPPVRHIPVPYQNRPNPPPVQTPQPTPRPAPRQQPPPLSSPTGSLGMPIQTNPTDGNTLVPWDAPMQCPPNTDPPDYPYPKGTNASMRCPYCGCVTLSPLTTGWFCTNNQCPARRELVQKGYTHNQSNNMTWRGL